MRRDRAVEANLMNFGDLASRLTSQLFAFFEMPNFSSVCMTHIISADQLLRSFQVHLI